MELCQPRTALRCKRFVPSTISQNATYKHSGHCCIGKQSCHRRQNCFWRFRFRQNRIYFMTRNFDFFHQMDIFSFFTAGLLNYFSKLALNDQMNKKTFLTDRERGLKRSLLLQSGLSWNPRWPLTLYGDLTGNTHLTSELRWAFPDAYAYMHIVIYAFNYSQKVESFQRT